MIVLDAAGYAVRRTTGLLLHPGLGVETATRIVSGRGAGTVPGPIVPPEDEVRRRKPAVAGAATQR